MKKSKDDFKDLILKKTSIEQSIKMNLNHIDNNEFLYYNLVIIILINLNFN